MLLLDGCQEELRSKEDVGYSDRQIMFAAADYEAVVTRSSENVKGDRSIFLGMAGKDSLFISVCETEAEQQSSVMTKGSGPYVPDSFHIYAFMDEDADPYVSLKVTSDDQWVSYSPALYWPNNFGKIHFFAYSYNLGNNHISPVNKTGGGNYSTTFDYTLPHAAIPDSDAEIQPDLIFAIAPEQQKTEDPVMLSFVHALSAIEFKIGNIGEATVVSSTARLTDILAKGQCTITHPATEDSIEWSTGSDRDSYSQTIEYGIPFMIIPQKLKDTEVSIEMSVKINDIIHEFPAKKMSELTDEWKPNKKYTYTITKGGEVKVDVRDSNTNIVKNNVKIQNTGFTTAYIRAAIIGYWYVVNDGMEEIQASWDISDNATGTLEKPADWENHWKEIDGFFYHIQPVVPGAYTKPLFTSYTLTKTTGPVSGSKLGINIAVQAIEQTKAGTYWPIDEL